MTDQTWVRGQARTISFPLPGDCALRGASVRPFPRVWPEKSAGDALDYSVDYTAWLADCSDIISKIAIDDVSVAPASGLLIPWAVFIGGVVSIGLSGGLAGQKYKIRIIVTTVQGRTITGIFTLPVSTMAPTIAAASIATPDLTFPAGTITINGTANA